MDLKEFITLHILSKSNKIISVRFNKKSLFYNENKNIMRVIEQSFGDTMSEKIYCILNDITTKPICLNENCNNEVSFDYFTTGYKQYCSQQCVKTSKLMVERVLSTKQKKYGNKNYNNRRKAKETMMDRFGFESSNQSELIKIKKKKTCQRKYGVDSPIQNKHIKTKMIDTNNKKYGVPFTTQTQNMKEKSSNTKKLRYGDKNFNNRKKAKETMQHKYNGHPTNSTIHINDYDNLYNLGFIRLHFFDSENYFDLDKYLDYFNVSQIVFYKGLRIKYPDVFKCRPHLPISKKERSLFNSLNVLNKIQSDKHILKGKELDIFLPDKRIAIEFNGLYWHSEEKGKSKDYHLDKTNKCEKKGIKLIHIFEHEWDYNKEAVLDKIHKLTKVTIKKEFKNVNVKEINCKIKKEFFRQNDFDVVKNSNLNVGVYENDELISVCTFTYKKNNAIMIKNYATKNKVCFEKTLHHIISYLKYSKKFSKIIFASNKCYHDNEEFMKCGFIKVNTTKPQRIKLSIPNLSFVVWDVGYDIFELTL